MNCSARGEGLNHLQEGLPTRKSGHGRARQGEALQKVVSLLFILDMGTDRVGHIFWKTNGVSDRLKSCRGLGLHIHETADGVPSSVPLPVLFVRVCGVQFQQQGLETGSGVVALQGHGTRLSRSYDNEPSCRWTEKYSRRPNIPRGSVWGVILGL